MLNPSIVFSRHFPPSPPTHFVRSPGRMSIASSENTFYYMVRESLCYLTMTEKSYPKRTAFLYLEEVADAISLELTKEFQNDVSLCIIRV